MTTPATISVVALMTMLAPAVEVTTATSCTVKALGEGVTTQTCPAGDAPQTRGDVRVYRGRSMGGEVRSSSTAVCTALYKEAALNYGAAGSVMSSDWSMSDNIKLRWRYDGSICTLSSFLVGFDPKMLIDFVIDGEVKGGKQ